MKVVPITGTIGAEILDIDLTIPFDEDTANLIYQALADHLVIFFPNQDISPADHLRLAKSFGEVDGAHPIYTNVPGFENIVELANDANNPPDTDGWHADLTFKSNPPFASILIAREIPEVGGDTLWSSLCAAYDALPEGMKTTLENMYALHDMGDFRNNFTVGEVSGDKLNQGMQRLGCAIHSIVKTHPTNGRKYLYINEAYTVHIIGKTARESRRLLNYLLDHISRPEYQVRFKWSKGAIAMWDNRCTQHYAVNDYLPAYRRMNRITVLNDRRSEPE